MTVQVRMCDIFNRDLSAMDAREMEVCGLVRSVRTSAQVAFVSIGDGSCQAALQLVCAPDQLPSGLGTGAAICARGHLQASQGAGQDRELLVERLQMAGAAGPDYPLQKKRHSREFLRSMPHLRPRTNLFNAVFRVRSGLAQQVHAFLGGRGFQWVHTPIVTASDCEGAGEQFRVLSAGELAGEEAFFGESASLSVSGQLELEAFAQAFGRVYSFGPTFRAENSNTSRHLSEFWMLEPEMAFAGLNEDMQLAEDLVRHLIGWVLEHCAPEVEFLDRFVDRGLIERLESMLQGSAFARLSYTEAVERLERSGESFEYPVHWGADLQSEHEKWLCRQLEGPVFVTDYPRDIKAFYMKSNADGRTVQAMDLLVPDVGELIGGSAREDDLDRLQLRIAELGIPAESLEWYLDLRRFGSMPHAGFGLGFERLVQYLTGMGNIRDVIPYPRAPGLI